MYLFMKFKSEQMSLDIYPDWVSNFDIFFLDTGVLANKTRFNKLTTRLLLDVNSKRLGKNWNLIVLSLWRSLINGLRLSALGCWDANKYLVERFCFTRKNDFSTVKQKSYDYPPFNRFKVERLWILSDSNSRVTKTHIANHSKIFYIRLNFNPVVLFFNSTFYFYPKANNRRKKMFLQTA